MSTALLPKLLSAPPHSSCSSSRMPPPFPVPPPALGPPWGLPACLPVSSLNSGAVLKEACPGGWGEPRGD